eukprot:s492_g16.t1
MGTMMINDEICVGTLCFQMNLNLRGSVSKETDETKEGQPSAPPSPFTSATCQAISTFRGSSIKSCLKASIIKGSPLFLFTWHCLIRSSPQCLHGFACKQECCNLPPRNEFSTLRGRNPVTR